MEDYKKMYLTLVGEMEVAIKKLTEATHLEQIEIERLKAALETAEELYIADK